MKGKDAFVALKSHCMAKDGAVEEYPWEHFGWKIRGKLFAIGTKDSGIVTVKSTPDKQAALIQHPAIEKASHVGRYGWVTINIGDLETLDLALDLVDESYDLVSPRKSRSRSKT